MFGLLTFALSMLLTALIPNVTVLNICAALSGIGFAVITTIPNTLVTLYHRHPETFFYDRKEMVAGYGEDIAILDSGKTCI